MADWLVHGIRGIMRSRRCARLGGQIRGGRRLGRGHEWRNALRLLRPTRCEELAPQARCLLLCPLPLRERAARCCHRRQGVRGPSRKPLTHSRSWAHHCALSRTELGLARVRHILRSAEVGYIRLRLGEGTRGDTAPRPHLGSMRSPEGAMRFAYCVLRAGETMNSQLMLRPLRGIAIMTTLATSLLTACSASRAAEERDAALDAAIPAAMQRASVPGAIVGIWQDGREPYGRSACAIRRPASRWQAISPCASAAAARPSRSQPS